MFVEIKLITTQDSKFDQLQKAILFLGKSWVASGDPLTHLHSSQIFPHRGCSCPRDDWGHDVGSSQFTNNVFPAIRRLRGEAITISVQMD